MADGSAGGKPKVQRPLSPHLQVHSLPVNMVMSILHRLTGAALYFGTLILAWWLVAAASGPAYFDYVNGLLGTWIGRLVLFGYTWALIHHALGGLRHFIWDTGSGYELETIDRLCWGFAAVSVLLTLAVWAVGLNHLGAFAR